MGIPARHLAALMISSVALLISGLLFIFFVTAPEVQAAFPGLNGKIAFESDRAGNYEIYTMSAGGSNQTRLTTNAATDVAPSWSPDGTKIAFASNRDGNSEIYVMNADGSGQTNLTNATGTDGEPSWSPDGTKIAFHSGRSGDTEIYTMNADGSGQTALTTNTTGDLNPSWSPDGSKIAFESDRDGNSEIYTMNASGSVQTRITNNAFYDSDPCWSPDGSRIAFANNGTGNYEIYVMSPDGLFSSQVTDNSSTELEPSWSPDGTKIAFRSFRDGNYEIYVINTDRSAETRLTTNTAADRASDWQPLPSYNWTWYDDVGGDNWVLMANPDSASQDLIFSLSIAGTPMSLTNGGVVAPGESITPNFGGPAGGPVTATSIEGGWGIVSQRILWPKGGSSLEEVPGTAFRRLSNHFWWPWYDEQSPGFKDWVLVANPNSFPVYYEVRVDGDLLAFGPIAAGANVAPHFPGIMGGAVEVQAWTDNTKFLDAKVMASQRVLSNGDSAFNEQVGIPDSELSNNYVWTWYDNFSPGAQDWILIANPTTNAYSLHYDIWIGGIKVATDETGGGGVPAGLIGYGEEITPRFSLPPTGPVVVKTYMDDNHYFALPSIASQRVIWGPSFSETPGYRRSDLAGNYHWSWYDQQSPGMQNWVLIANVDSVDDVVYSVKIGGQAMAAGSLAPGEHVTPTFTQIMDGPVEVIAVGGDAIASQRVIYNGYFNEVLGTVLE
ncbi:MAG: hypothetical protein ACYC6O_07610 [Thermoleophilia bacterium]